MCGHVGIMGNPSGLQDRIFEFLIQIDVVRGKDSTGMAAIMKNRVEVLKGACLPQILLNSKEYKATIARQNYCLIGHNRWKTQGEIKADNAHPFRHGNITLAHNGTLVTTYGLPGHGQFDTDSETICHSINEIGIKKTWKLLDGPAALVWWDSKDKTLHFLRNEERPLWFSYMRGMKGLVWASESWMVDTVFEIFDNAKRFTSDDNSDCWYPKANDHFTFKWNGNKVEVNAETLEPKPKQVYIDKGRAASSNSNVSELFPGLTRVVTENRTKYDDKGIAPWADADDELIKWYCSSDSKKKTITEAEYKKNFHICAGCEENINNSFQSVVIVDTKAPYKAFCDDCAQTAALNGIDINNIGSH